MKSPILIFLLAIGLGLLYHQASAHTSKMPHGWDRLTDYTIGVTGTAPLCLLWFRHLDGVRNLYVRVFCAFMLAFLGVGIGTAAGWWVDSVITR